MSEQALDTAAPSPTPAPDDTQSPAVVEVTPEIEAHARLLGWRPQAEFNGPADKWRPADEFISRSHQHNGILRENLEKTMRQLSTAHAQIEEMRRAQEDFAKFKQESEERAFKRALKTLDLELADAVSKGDGEAYARLQSERDQLRNAEPAKPVTPAAPPASAPATLPTDWTNNNSWYGKDPDLTRYAETIGVGLNANGVRGRELLDKVAEEVRARYPDKFRSSAPPSPDAGGVRSPASSGRAGKRYEDLPAEARDACDRFVKQKLVTREDYVKEYFS